MNRDSSYFKLGSNLNRQVRLASAPDWPGMAWGRPDRHIGKRLQFRLVGPSRICLSNLGLSEADLVTWAPGGGPRLPRLTQVPHRVMNGYRGYGSLLGLWFEELFLNP